ncbi:MAG: pyridoxal phosphate-dependent aminotransferase [Methanophagales archaeon]|nr:pyridoxal phosphate-dependent aminotransferase [Methanophagales archaeon]
MRFFEERGLKERVFADRVLEVERSATLEYDAIAKRPGMINLTVGRPDFDTPSVIKEAAKKALDEGKVHYTPSNGIPELRKAIAEKLEVENNIPGLNEDNIIVSGGGKLIIYCIIMALAGKGDVVAIQNPTWVSYEAQIRLANAEVEWLTLKPEEGFIPGDEFMSQLEATDAKLFILNSPGNPTGAVIPEKRIKEMMDICLEKEIFVIADEVYEKLIYEGEHYSPASEYENVITVNAFSKTYSMTGWRLGYCAHPDREIIERIGIIHQQSLSCCTSFAQYGALAAFSADAKDASERFCKELKRRRDYVMDRIRKMDGVVCVKPGGAFYLFPYLGHVDDLELADELLEKGVGVVPGSAFGSQGRGCIRISYGSANLNLLSQAFDRIQDSGFRVHGSRLDI